MGALCGLLVWALIGIPIFVFPNTGPLPKHADVVLVLGNLTEQRTGVAERLLKEGVVDEMLWSTPTGPLPTHPTFLEQCRQFAHLTCFVPDPSTTQGEARELRAQARAHGWKSAVVVTEPSHVFRAQTIIRRCFSGVVTMAASTDAPSGGIVQQYVYQTVATVKMWLNPGC